MKIRQAMTDFHGRACPHDDPPNAHRVDGEPTLGEPILALYYPSDWLIALVPLFGGMN
jgi:hypothetical protein